MDWIWVALHIIPLKGSMSCIASETTGFCLQKRTWFLGALTLDSAAPYVTTHLTSSSQVSPTFSVSVLGS